MSTGTTAQTTAAQNREDLLLKVDNLVKHFSVGGGFLKKPTTVYAVNDVSFDLRRGETLALVGESGCGKTTVGKTLMGFHPPTSGRVWFDGREIGGLSRRELRSVRRDLQFVFQDPYASLPARSTVQDILTEPLQIHGIGDRRSRQARAYELLDLVGLRPALASRYPHEFSGGQRQRIGIARALALEPKMLVLDEPVSALDVSVQAQVVNLLERLQSELDLGYVFIAHDLGVVRHISDRIAVMYLGSIVEYGAAADIFDSPQHPYTQALLSAVPIPDPRRKGMASRRLLSGDLPSPTNRPTGCAFRGRCWRAQEVCATDRPPLEPVPSGARAACHFPGPEPRVP
ncbi:peptide ABC transporter ATP-binding protein [Enemella dayhoffiae]|uniref:Peptide ABC transporter ATP-binding protein n=1 Tax=Enemella dayhoffiae TaxID=2016507 RepID=A0A255H4K8_9ACTN|nr:oligopeptide/dipeptide ABC transporter ATP-binding protein [Enemella dayhoffiae]OYO22173.1 peptide ABC transporter ATP-binding protein [Enemella dayhoffiae]